MRIGRKRKILVEKNILSIDTPKQHIILHNNIIKHSFEPLQSHNFIVELEMKNGQNIDDYRIMSFKIDNFADHKTLKICSILDVDKWIHEFTNVIIAKIFFMNNIGQTVGMFDFDVSFSGYSMEGDYNDIELLKPTFSYKIIED